MPAPVANAPPSDPSSSSTMSGALAGSAMAKAAEASLERAPAPAAAGPTTTGSHATHTHTAMPPPASPARTGAGAAAANGTRRARANTSPWSFAPNQQPPRSPLMAPPPPVSPNRSGVSPYHPPHPRQPPVSSSMVPPPPFFPAAMGGGAGGVGGGVGRPLTPPISPSGGGRRHIHHAPFIHHGHYVHGHHLSQYDAARREAIQHAAEGERRRIGDLEKAESGSDVDVGSLRAALKRERKHSTKLAMELAEWKSLNVQCQAEAEMNEEGRVNHLMRRLECLQREKGRIIVELEREEEMLTNTLQKKLNEVRREKERLEKQIEREHSSNRDLRSRIESSSTTTTSNEGGKSAAAAATTPVDRWTDRGTNETGATTPSASAEPMQGSAASLEIPESIAEEEGGSDEEKD